MNELFENMNRGAQFSQCGLYRYRLWRIWDENKPFVLFVMLNPSTADENQDDPTVRRCIGFARSWGFGGLYVGNLFAYRCTKPEGLLGINRPVGEMNPEHLLDMAKKCKKVICAWGNGKLVKKLMSVQYWPLSEMELYCIARCKDGTPAHPLYLKKDSVPGLFSDLNNEIENNPLIL